MDIVEPTIEAYLETCLPERPPVVQEMEAKAKREHFPAIGPLVGNLVYQLAQMVGAKQVLELGSGFGYSTYWFARAVGNDGRVIHTDFSAENTSQARNFLSRLKLVERVEFRTGDALDIIQEFAGPFDIIFIDISKPDYPQAFDLAIDKLRPGGLMITDNVLQAGSTVTVEDDDTTRGMKAYTQRAYDHPELVTTVIPLREGVAVSWKRD